MKELDKFDSLKGLERLIYLNSSLARDLGLSLLSVLLGHHLCFTTPYLWKLFKNVDEKR